MATNLASAKDKIRSGIEFDDLPGDRIDPLWDRIEKTFVLTPPELSALKNARCGHAPPSASKP